MGELCGCLPLSPLASRHRCDLPVRCSHLLVVDCHLARLSSTNCVLISLFTLLSVSSEGLSLRFRSRSTVSDLSDAGTVELLELLNADGRIEKEATGFRRSCSTVLISAVQQGICRKLQPNPLS